MTGKVVDLGPRVDAPADVGHPREALRPQKLRHALTAPAVVAEHEQVAIARQAAQCGGHVAHRQQFAAGDLADGVLERLAHVEQRGALLCEQRAGCGDADDP